MFCKQYDMHDRRESFKSVKVRETNTCGCSSEIQDRAATEVSKYLLSKTDKFILSCYFVLILFVY